MCVYTDMCKRVQVCVCAGHCACGYRTAGCGCGGVCRVGVSMQCGSCLWLPMGQAAAQKWGQPWGEVWGHRGAKCGASIGQAMGQSVCRPQVRPQSRGLPFAQCSQSIACWPLQLQHPLAGGKLRHRTCPCLGLAHHAATLQLLGHPAIQAKRVRVALPSTAPPPSAHLLPLSLPTRSTRTG